MSLKSTSKYISLILRHKPEAIGISLDEYGWANVDELIYGKLDPVLAFTMRKLKVDGDTSKALEFAKLVKK